MPMISASLSLGLSWYLSFDKRTIIFLMISVGWTSSFKLYTGGSRILHKEGESNGTRRRSKSSPCYQQAWIGNTFSLQSKVSRSQQSFQRYDKLYRERIIEYCLPSSTTDLLVHKTVYDFVTSVGDRNEISKLPYCHPMPSDWVSPLIG